MSHSKTARKADIGSDGAASRRGFLGLAAAAMLGLPACATRPFAELGQVPPFSRAPTLGTIPPGWEPYVVRRDLPQTEYRIAALEGRRVLEASGRGVSSGLRCGLSVDPHVLPWLRWKWQASAVPDGMCVADRDADDSPARVVISFDGDHRDLPGRDRAFFELVELVTGQRLPYATLMYVWDARLPVGTLVSYARTSRIRYLVVESGPHRSGRWLSYERDLRADYRAAFGDEAGRLLNAGVLTDSDDLQVEVQAWYGDITLSAR